MAKQRNQFTGLKMIRIPFNTLYKISFYKISMVWLVTCRPGMTNDLWPTVTRTLFSRMCCCCSWASQGDFVDGEGNVKDSYADDESRGCNRSVLIGRLCPSHRSAESCIQHRRWWTQAGPGIQGQGQEGPIFPFRRTESCGTFSPLGSTDRPIRTGDKKKIRGRRKESRIQSVTLSSSHSILTIFNI